MTSSSSSAPWKHSWKHAIFDRYGDPSFEIEVVSYKQTSDEIVEDFASYLMGCGFFQSNIIESFEDYIKEHKEPLITGANRLKDVDESSFTA